LFALARLYLVALGDEPFGLGSGTAGELLVELAAGLNRPPVRGNIFLSLSDVLFGCTSRYPDKDAGGDRSAEAGAVPPGHDPAYLVDGN
jgi:hypothetical protein